MKGMMGVTLHECRSKKYFVILVNYGNAQLTLDCIESLNEAGCDNSRIVVVDNASPDDSLVLLRKIKDIKLIESDQNGGFAYGNNLGIEWAMDQGCAGVILLNNDTIVARDFFEEIFKGSEDEVCTPKIYYFSDPDKIWHAGKKFFFHKGKAYGIGKGKKDSPEFSVEKYTDCACGCCLKIPRSVLDKVGLLDEQYFMYAEDDDYSLRLNQAGVKIRYLPMAKIWHKEGMSSGAGSRLSVYYMTRNRFYILKKYHFSVSAWIYTIAEETIRYMLSLVKNSNNRMILKAWKDYKKGIMGKVDI